MVCGCLQEPHSIKGHMTTDSISTGDGDLVKISSLVLLRANGELIAASMLSL